MNQTAPRRRWAPRLSLTTTLALFMALCVGTGLIARRANDQRQAVQTLLRKNALLVFDYQLERAAGLDLQVAGLDLQAAPPGWFGAWGRDVFHSVIEAYPNSETPLDAETCDALGRLRGLQSLSINVPRGVALESLAPLRSIRGLKNLSLYTADRGDEIIDALPALDNVAAIQLYGVALTDAGLTRLQARLSPDCCRSLRLSDTQLSDAQVQRFATALPQCRVRRYGYD